MASFIWQRDPDEAYQNPYEYAAQEQFLREAYAILEGLRALLNQYDMTFYRDERTVKKAIWLLHTDTLCSLLDAAVALKEKRHRPAARVFRDIVENMDLAKYFHSVTPASARDLDKWYDNEVIVHSRYRKQVEKMHGVEIANELSRRYSSLSKYTHRTYRAIISSCGLGRDDLLWHENHSPSFTAMLPQPVAAYCAVLADFVFTFCSEVATRGLVDAAVVKKLVSDSMESMPAETMLESMARHYEEGRVE